MSRNYLFDALRGVAAMFVVTYHLCLSFNTSGVAGGYLAVDLFFILSGYVIARAYKHRLISGLSVWKFALIRIARLYPAYFIGFLLGIVELLSAHFVHGSPSIHSVALVVVFNGLMLPAVFGIHAIFPANYPAWSLFAEFIVNLIYAAVLFRLQSRWLFVFIGACALISGIGAVKLGSGINAGPDWTSIGYALGRTGAAFGIGIMVARHRPANSVPTFAAPLVICALAAALLAPVAAPLRTFADYALAYILFPALIWTGAEATVPKLARPVCEWLGELSYPLYCIHAPVILIVLSARSRLHLSIAAAMAIALVATATITIVYTFWFDRPGRRWLGKRLGV